MSNYTVDGNPLPSGATLQGGPNTVVRYRGDLGGSILLEIAAALNYPGAGVQQTGIAPSPNFQIGRLDAGSLVAVDPDQVYQVIMADPDASPGDPWPTALQAKAELEA